MASSTKQSAARPHTPSQSTLAASPFLSLTSTHNIPLSLSLSLLCLLAMCICAAFQLSLCVHHYQGTSLDTSHHSRFCILNALCISLLSLAHAYLYFSLSALIQEHIPSMFMLKKGLEVAPRSQVTQEQPPPNQHKKISPKLATSSLNHPIKSHRFMTFQSSPLSTSSTVLNSPTLKQSKNYFTSPVMATPDQQEFIRLVHDTYKDILFVPIDDPSSPVSPHAITSTKPGYHQRLPDKDIIKFYVGHKCKTEVALGKIGATLKWMTEYNFDTLLDEDFTALLEAKKFYHAGFAKDGVSPVILFRASHHFAGDNAWNVRFMVYMVEKWKREGIIQDKIVLILDRLNFTDENKDDDIVRHIANVFQYHYPETLARLFIVPRTFLLNVAWRIVKLFLDPVTVSKVFVLGDDYLPTLLEHIESDQLLERFGGTLADPTDVADYMDKELLIFKQGIESKASSQEFESIVNEQPLEQSTSSHPRTLVEMDQHMDAIIKQRSSSQNSLREKAKEKSKCTPFCTMRQ